jgi:hypothetical protein
VSLVQQIPVEVVVVVVKMPSLLVVTVVPE